MFETLKMRETPLLAGLEDETERLDLPVARGCPALVAHRDAALVEHRAGHRRQMRRCLGFAVPVRGIEVEARAHSPRTLAHRRRQRGHELAACAVRRLAEAQGRGLARQADHQHGLGLVGREPGEPGAIALDELEAAAGPAVGVDGDAGGAERLDIPVDRAHRNLEFLGERLCRETHLGLQKHQDRKQPARTHGAW